MKHFRAILILIHIFAINIIAFPTPRGALSKKHVAKPDIQESIALWHRILIVETLFGHNKEQFAKDIVKIGRWLVDTQAALTAPFAPYYKYAGTRQSWQMFGYVSHSSGQLHIEVFQNEEWTPLYIDLQKDCQWRGGQLNQERVRAMRSLFAQKKMPKKYRRFVNWTSKKAFQDFPDAKKFKVYYKKRAIPKPKEFRKDGFKLGDNFWTTVIKRDEL